MNNVTDAFTLPNINGTFNNFCGSCSPMTDANADGVWEITLQLAAGIYEYKYSADGWNIQESLTPGSSCTVTNFSFTNRTITVSADQVVPVVCYGACVACNAVVPSYNVTFQVDMNNNTDNFAVANLNGSFNNWCGGCAAMSDANSDGIWDITVVLEAGTYEYKFTADGWNFSETLTEGASCTVNAAPYVNRTLTVSSDITLPVVCYGSCTACTKDVTFKVNMNNVTDPFTTAYVNGTFNGWCGTCNPMSDANSDGIWEVTLPLPTGSIEYKFTADGWNLSETLTQGAPCTVNDAPYVNRSLNVTTDTTLDAVCWGSCSVCSAPTYNVTFLVDMNNVTAPFTTPEVNGQFNGWCGGCAPMTDANADGIWELTIALEAGTYEYKFAADGWNIQESLAPGSSCTLTTGAYTNRLVTVTGNTVLPVVCYGFCSACSIGCTDNTACNYSSTANVNSGCTYASLSYYVDGDNDGYGAGSAQLFCSNPGAGYSANNSDCNDSNANIRPGAADLCSNSIDDDCDGIVNDGCYASNNDRSSATSVGLEGYPNCNNIQGNFSLATPDVVGEGADLWYRFTATSNAARIAVVGNTATNTAIEVEDAAGNTVGAIEDASSSNGNEIFLTEDLTAGQQYYVAVRNAGGAAGSFTVCIQSLKVSNCDNGPNFSSLCHRFKADWTNTSVYSAVLTSVSNPLNSYSYTTTSGSFMLLSEFVPSVDNVSAGGLQYGQSYSVLVSSVYTLADAAGNIGTYTATPTASSCIMNILAQPNVNLNATYASSGAGINPRKLNSYVPTNAFLCGIVSYNWMFIPVDPLTNDPLTTELTTYYNSGSSSRYMQLSAANIPGIAAGKRYRVHVQPVFNYGIGAYDMSSSVYVQILAPAGMNLENSTEAMATRTFIADNSATEFAVYPNPNNGEVFNLNVSGITEGLWEMTIIDVQGKEVMNGQMISENGINTMITPSTKLTAGVYMINLTNGSEILSTRLVVR
jgi:hypothetical protein